MYEYGTLRPPTQAEMEARYLPLETIKVSWLEKGNYKIGHIAYPEAYVGAGDARDAVWEGAIAELAHFMAHHVIPMGARLVYHECGTHQMALDWTHLELCKVCKCWREPHEPEDFLHQLMLAQRSRELVTA